MHFAGRVLVSVYLAVVVVRTSRRQHNIIGARVCGGRQSGGKDSKLLNNER